MTRGGRKALHTAAISTTSAVASTTGSELIYTKHTFLRREGGKLLARAKALGTNTRCRLSSPAGDAGAVAEPLLVGGGDPKRRRDRL